MTTISSLADQFGSERRIPTWEHFWFHKVPEEEYREVARTAQRGTGRPDVTAQLGAYLLREFLAQTWEENYRSFADDTYPGSQSATAAILGPGGRCVAVHTCQRRDDVVVSPLLELRVPDTRPYRGQDLHVLAGFCPESGYGYLYGWATQEEIEAEPVRHDLRYPSRALPLSALHPLQELPAWVRETAAP